MDSTVASDSSSPDPPFPLIPTTTRITTTTKAIETNKDEPNNVNKNTQKIETDENSPATNNVVPVVPSHDEKKASPTTSASSEMLEDGEDLDGLDAQERLRKNMAVKKAMARAREQGIWVVSAFEGYAFDYGMQVGDKLWSVDGVELMEDATVEDVRNLLRGDPGTSVEVSFVRDGVQGQHQSGHPIIGPQDGSIGYIQLIGFTQDAGLEVCAKSLLPQIAYRLPEARTQQSNEQNKALLMDLCSGLQSHDHQLRWSTVDVFQPQM
eukprot:scaffold62821_cov31-Attheya_sp.AAC.1